MQFDFGNLSSPLSGAELADGVLEPWRDALHSSHMGDSRPSYVVPGMWWIDNATTPWVAKVFQGSDDIVMGTLDPATLVFVPSGTDAPTAAVTSYDPTGNTVITGTNVQDALDDVEPVLAGLGTAAVEDVPTIRLVPQTSQSAAYTLDIDDIGHHIFHPSADTTARTWTIPANSSVPFPIGTAVTFVNQDSAGVITIAITTDTMRLAGAGTTGSRTLAANGVATALKVTSTEWIISGTGLS